MPLYDYRAPDGGIYEILIREGRPPDTLEIEGKRCIRSCAHRFAVTGTAPPPTQGQEVLKGYRDQEVELGSRFKSTLSALETKRLWKDDEPDAAYQ